MSSSGPKKQREGRTPRRSRFGCRNCKLRKLKVSGIWPPGLNSPVVDCSKYQCDECKPQCQRCSSFGILCNFMSNVPDLQSVAADTGHRSVVRRNAELQPPPTNAIWTSNASTSYQLNAKGQDFISRYFRRSLLIPDDINVKQVNSRLLELAFSVSFTSQL